MPETMKFITHNDREIDTMCSSLKGYIDISFDELVEKLGKPTCRDEYKTDAQWTLQFEDGIVASIYNYKNGRNYLGAGAPLTEEIKDWNIGGYKENAVIHVGFLFPNHNVRHWRI